MATDHTKVLFVLSHDYGELFNALYFLKDTPTDAGFVMPSRLHALNRAFLPCPSYIYKSASDIIAVTERERPTHVFLFSGYLYAVNRIMDAQSVEYLVRQLGRLGSLLATSDPSLGLLSHVTKDTFSRRHPAHAWLTDHFAWLSNLLATLPHLYLAPDGLPGIGRRISYFNPSLIANNADRTRHRHILASYSALSPTQPFWFFVISPEDYAIQVGVRGRDAFHEILLARLADAQVANRQAVLVAPSDCLAAITAHSNRSAHLACYSALPNDHFMALLLEAEYVFYWNIFSATILGRLLNSGPIFAFDRGHLARAMPGIWLAGTTHFFPNCHLPMRDHGKTLDPIELAESAARQSHELFQPVYQNLSRSMTPQDVLQQIR